MAGLDEFRAMVDDCVEKLPAVQAYHLLKTVASIVGQGDGTPADVDPRPVKGHIAVLVGGLGSGSRCSTGTATNCGRCGSALR